MQEYFLPRKLNHSKYARLYGTTIQLFLVLSVLTIVDCGTYWAPAVGTKDEIERLPESQKDIRCIAIGDDELLLVCQRLKRLEYLFINQDSRITDIGIKGLLELKFLKKIVIYDCSRITNKGFSTFSDLPQLTELMLQRGFLIPDQGILTLSNNKGLKIISLTDFPQVTREALIKLQESLPECNVALHEQESSSKTSKGD